MSSTFLCRATDNQVYWCHGSFSYIYICFPPTGSLHIVLPFAYVSVFLIFCSHQNSCHHDYLFSVTSLHQMSSHAVPYIFLCFLASYILLYWQIFSSTKLVLLGHSLGGLGFKTSHLLQKKKRMFSRRNHSLVVFKQSL